MSLATRSEVIRVLAVLSAAYPKEAAAYGEKTVTGELYIRMLADIPGKWLEAGALQHISNSTWFPLIAELRKAAFDIQESVHPLPDAYTAWAEVQNLIPSVTHLGTPTFSHPLIQETVDLFGWRFLCLSEDMVSNRSHFIKAYEAKVEQRRASAHRHKEIADLIQDAQCLLLSEDTQS